MVQRADVLDFVDQSNVVRELVDYGVSNFQTPVCFFVWILQTVLRMMYHSSNVLRT